MSFARSSPDEFAIRVASIDGLFAPLDARPIAERSLDEDVRLHLLDEWEDVREARPSTLTVYAPAGERSGTDEEAVSAAVRANLRAYTRRLRKADPLSRRDRIAAWVGITIFLLSIVVSTLLDRVTSDVIVAGVSQGIVVVGWVALWVPAQRVAVDVLPHHFARKRYAEMAEVEVRFAWQGASEPPAARGAEPIQASMPRGVIDSTGVSPS
ncbi:MAG: hypothetical protein ACR2MK_09815 [Solirubrobacteraceae bacterium]